MNKPLVWSYSFLSTYDRCARQGQARYITKEIKFVETPEMAKGNRVHSAAETALKLRQFPEVPYDDMIPYFRSIYSIPAKELLAEQQLGVDRNWNPVGFFDKNVWGRGKLDVTALINYENAILFDWKTGNTWEDPTELKVQAVLLKAKHPNLKKIKGAYIWLKEGKWGDVYDLSDTIDNTKEWIENTVHKVEQGLFYAQPNKLCGWCDLTTCKHWKARK